MSASLSIQIPGRAEPRGLSDGLVVGRDPDCAVVVDDHQVSRFHCRFELDQDGEWVVRDLGSRNGTLLNGARIDGAAPIVVGDRLVVGPAELVVSAGAATRAGAGPAQGPGVVERVAPGEERLFVDPRRFDETRSPGQLQRQVNAFDRLSALYRNSLLASAAESSSAVIDAFFMTVRELFGPRGQLLFVHDGRQLQIARADDDADATRYAEIAENVFEDRASVLYRPEGADELTLLTPLRTPNSLLGVVAVVCDADSGRTRDDLELLVALGNQAALAAEAAREREGLRAENARLRLAVGAPRVLVGDSKEMSRIRTAAAQLATTDHPVLLTGELGTGKEHVAAAIHAQSRRRHGPMVAVRCDASDGPALLRDLFGDAQRPSAFEQAGGGTLFFDEVAALPRDAQDKLLDVLTRRVIDRTDTPTAVDVRVLSATQRDLDDRVDRGEFSSKLYYALTPATLALPPLRDRFEDMSALALHLLQRIAYKLPRHVDKIGPGVVEALCGYHWPGNVRELANAVERAALQGVGDEIRVEDLTGIRRSTRISSIDDEVPTLRDAEARHIRRALETSSWDAAEAARALGVDVTIVTQKIAEYGWNH